MEMHADAEHQQDDADLGHLGGELGVGDEPRRVGADGDPGEHVADQGRQSEPLGDPAEGERHGERAGEGHDDGEIVHDRSIRAAERRGEPRQRYASLAWAAGVPAGSATLRCGSTVSRAPSTGRGLAGRGDGERPRHRHSYAERICA